MDTSKYLVLASQIFQSTSLLKKRIEYVEFYLYDLIETRLLERKYKKHMSVKNLWNIKGEIQEITSKFKKILLNQNHIEYFQKVFQTKPTAVMLLLWWHLLWLGPRNQFLKYTYTYHEIRVNASNLFNFCFLKRYYSFKFNGIVLDVIYKFIIDVINFDPSTIKKDSKITPTTNNIKDINDNNSFQTKNDKVVCPKEMIIALLGDISNLKPIEIKIRLLEIMKYDILTIPGHFLIRVYELCWKGNKKSFLDHYNIKNNSSINNFKFNNIEFKVKLINLLKDAITLYFSQLGIDYKLPKTKYITATTSSRLFYEKIVKIIEKKKSFLQYIFLVDLDNCHTAFQSIFNLLEHKATQIPIHLLFLKSHYDNQVFNNLERLSYCTCILIEKTTKDAADTTLSYFTGILDIILPNSVGLGIISRDNFSIQLTEVLETQNRRKIIPQQIIKDMTQDFAWAYLEHLYFSSKLPTLPLQKESSNIVKLYYNLLSQITFNKLKKMIITIWSNWSEKICISQMIFVFLQLRFLRYLCKKKYPQTYKSIEKPLIIVLKLLEKEYLIKNGKMFDLVIF